MDLRARRGLIGSNEPEEELYPIGTNIITWSGYRAARNENKAISRSNGEYHNKTSDYENGASEIFIPVSTKYTYRKSNDRIYTLAYYDANKNFLGYRIEDNLTIKAITLLKGTKYIRLTWWAGNNLGLSLTRIA